MLCRKKHLSISMRINNARLQSNFLGAIKVTSFYLHHCRASGRAVINDRKCHHVCFTWKSAGGQYAFYKDGKLVGSGGGLSTGQRIPGGGVLSLAQRSVRPSLAIRYVGRITGVNIWNKVLTRQDIEKMSKCGGSTVGNVKSWADFKLQGSSKFAKYVKNVCPLGANCGAS